MPTPIRYDGPRRTTWRVRVRVGNRQTSETFTSRSLALQFCKLVDAIGPAAAVAQRNRTDRESTDYVPTVAQWLATHVDTLTGVTARTRLDYQALAARTFIPIVGDMPLDTIDRRVAAHVINTLEQQPTKRGGKLSEKSIRNAHGLLSSLMRTAERDGLVTSNPFAGIRLPRTGEDERKDARFLTHDDWERLHAALHPDWRDFVQYLLGTGFRWSEATASFPRDVNLDAGLIRVERAWKRTPGHGITLGPPKSKKSRRTIYPGEPVLAAVERVVYSRGRDDLLWQARGGGVIHAGNFRTRIWVPAVKQAGLTDVRIHDLRHTCASFLIEEGASLEQVQDWLGHEQFETTRKVYAHLQPAMALAMRDISTRALAPRPVTVRGQIVSSAARSRLAPADLDTEVVGHQ